MLTKVTEINREIKTTIEEVQKLIGVDLSPIKVELKPLRQQKTGAKANSYQRTITLNWNYFKLQKNFPEIREIVLHELAHILVGCSHGHDDVWRRCYIMIGGNGEQYHSMDVSRGF